MHIMVEGNPMDGKYDDGRLKRLMKAATGCDNVDAVRNSTPQNSKPVDSAMEFLASMEDDENFDANQNAGDIPKMTAPSPKEDEILKSVSLAGPEPKPPAPRDIPETAEPSLGVTEEADQSSDAVDPSMTPQQQSSSSDDEKPNHTITWGPNTVESTDNDLSYKWISVVYAIGSLLSLAFYLLENYGSRPQRSFVASLNDLYIVFLPYIPCLVWILLRLNLQRNTSVPIIDAAKKEQ